jgi:hypothetical protein
VALDAKHDGVCAIAQQHGLPPEFDSACPGIVPVVSSGLNCLGNKLWYNSRRLGEAATGVNFHPPTHPINCILCTIIDNKSEPGGLVVFERCVSRPRACRVVRRTTMACVVCLVNLSEPE